MKNSLVLLAVVLSVAAFAGMMRIKTDVQTMDRERLRLVHERAELRETKRVLEAEWALLASPERLQRLVAGKGYVAASALDVMALDRGGVSATLAVSSVAPVSAAAVVSEAMVEVKREVAAVVASPTEAAPDMSTPSGTEPLAGVSGAED